MKITHSIIFTALLLASASQSIYAKEWVFNAKLDGRSIGQHSFTLTENGDSKKILSQAKFNVKVLFINAYKYNHVANEEWQGDCLTNIKTHTEENKEITDVTGSLEAAKFVVKNPKGQEKLGECVMTFAYWNPKMLEQSKLLNPQTGDWLDAKITALGNEEIQVRGKPTQAQHYSLTAPKMKIDLWYTIGANQQKEWVALKSTTPEGYVISYELK